MELTVTNRSRAYPQSLGLKVQDSNIGIWFLESVISRQESMSDKGSFSTDTYLTG